MALKKGGLGKGLDAIFIENDTEDNNTVFIKISELEPNRDQPRKEFDEEALAELAESIAQHGILQPLLVRPIAGECYQIIAGERRWRASRMAGLTEVPVIIRNFTDKETMEIALIENLQREDLSPIEEALGYKSLIDTYGFTQEQLSKTVGKSRSAIANALRLLNLPDSVLNLISKGELSSGHARALLTLNNENDIERMAKITVEKMLSVREVEKMCKNLNYISSNDKKETKTKSKRNPFFDEVELALKESLGRKIKVKDKANKNKGILEIEFYSDDDLAYIARCLGDMIS